MIVYAFDRDNTVSLSKGPVPIEAVRKLRELGSSVWAIGNSRLVQEAGIQFASRDRKAVVHPNERDRRDRLRYIKEQVPKAEAYIVVDDEDLSDMVSEGWFYFKPETFAKIVYDLRRS